MESGSIMFISAAVLAAIAGMLILRAAAGRRASTMPIDAEEKARKVREIYARAKDEIARLRAERRRIVEGYVKAADQARVARAKKELEGL
jgi:hypothetical protein